MATHRQLLGLVGLVVLHFSAVIVSGQTTGTEEPDTTQDAGTTTTTSPSPSKDSKTDHPEYEYPPYDGWYNNRANPDWGAADTQLLRRLPAAYSDGSYEPAGEDRPNPFEVSRNVFNGSTGMGSDRNATALLVFFGQQVVEEILDAQRPGCPPEYFNIKVPKGHEQYDKHSSGDKEMPFLRSRYDMRTGLSPNNPRQQLNEITPWLDGGLVYGPNKAWADTLRLYKGGLLAATNDTDSEEGYYPALNDIRLPMANPPPPRQHKLESIKRFYKLGNPRGNENPFLLTMGILWFRYHNYKAYQLAADHPDWDDETIFNEARKWVIAVHQSVVVYDWLANWLGGGKNMEDGLEPYKGYDPSIHPGITHVFQSAAMRFGHTMVTPGVYRRNENCVFRKTTKKTVFEDHRAVRTCNTFWNPQESIRESGIEEFLMGMASQIAEREDMIITPDLRGDVFGPLEFSRRDLMAINIQRGRDHGLPDYNTARVEYNLSRITDWEEINPDLYSKDKELFDRMKTLYNNDLDNIDIWPGGMLETTPQGPGPLFRAIIRDQFRRIRDGDRFWFENYKINHLFNETEVEEIRSTTLLDVVKAVTDIPDSAVQSDTLFFHYNGDPCPQPVQLSHDMLANCTEMKTFDYFSGSEASYALSFAALVLSIFLCIGLLLLCARRHDKQVEEKRFNDRAKSKKLSDKASFIPAVEWISMKNGTRNIRLKLDEHKKALMVNNEKNKPLRTIDLTLLKHEGNVNRIDVMLSADKHMRMMVLRVPKEYDLILQFDHPMERQRCLDSVKEFLGEMGVGMGSPSSQTERAIKTQCITQEMRQQQLEVFFKAIFSHAFHLEVGEDFNPAMLDNNEARNVLNCELTKVEFAEALALKQTSMFVENMFKLVDKDDNGYISFREFLDMFVIFSKGNADDKAELLFNMYDIDGTGTLDKGEFKLMLRSLLEMSNADIEDHKINDVVNDLFLRAGLAGRQEISLADFQHMLVEYKQELQYASLGFEGAPGGPAPAKRDIATARARKTLYKAFSDGEEDDMRRKRFSQFPSSEIKTIEKEYPRSYLSQKYNAITRFVENYKLHIFWVSLYTLVSFGIFIERAYYYSVEREHAGLRRIAGYGVTVTRGAASGMMFTYSCLLVTMCRNTITFLRETVLHRFIPFDGAIAMHKYIAFLALFFTVMHCIGHAINFYHVSTQTANDLICLFRDFFHATDELPKFHRWCWETLTGFTGVLATILTILMYVFAIQYARRHAFKWFWFTHNMYIILFILMLLHGAGRLVQPPFFHYFLLGPLVMFTLDKLITVSRNKAEIKVLKAELLPSEVIYLEFRRPPGFDYKSGQWVRIACLAQGSNEYHPFTIASAPHEENLGLYIRAVGPWTMNLRETYNPALTQSKELPKIYLDGPYGEGHQDWYRFEVAVLVGGGIGVTPFASILKDLVNTSNNRMIRCKKVYFLWVTRTQKQFEWMTDIIREVEEKDRNGLVSIHIFITQFKQKFDIRTTMLYICERHFQKISNRSLFTGLKSITHFGRPDFESFFRMLLQEHSTTNMFGVFSCGPPPMTLGVENTCSRLNKYIKNALFVHHYENF